MFAPTRRPWLLAWSSCSTRCSVASAPVGVDHDAVCDRQSGVGGQLTVRLDTEAGDDSVHRERPSAAERDLHHLALPVDSRHRFRGQDGDVAVSVVVVQCRRQRRWKHARADPCFREDHRHPVKVERKRGRDLGANEAAADDQEAVMLLGEAAQPVVVSEGAEVDDLVAAERELARPAPGC